MLRRAIWIDPCADSGLRTAWQAGRPRADADARIIVLVLPFTMPAMSHTATAPANAEKRYTVHRGDLPLSCPTPEMALWNSHPRVYLPIEDEPNGEAKCAYCGAVFVLAD